MIVHDCGMQIDAANKELLERGTPEFPIACYQDLLTSEGILWHWHEELEAAVLTQGSAVLVVGEREYTLRANTGFFINSERLHMIRNASDQPCVIHSIVFHERLVGGADPGIIRRKYVTPIINHAALDTVFFSADKPWQRQAIADIHSAWESCLHEAEGYEILTRNALTDLMFLLTGHQNEIAPLSPATTRETRQAERMRKMLRYIHQNIEQNIGVSDIAESAGISKSECLRCFHDFVHSTPNQYLQTLRLSKAVTLLSSTDQKIADIGKAVGFQDISYFNRVFRKAKGCTPGQWRTKNRTYNEKGNKDEH